MTLGERKARYRDILNARANRISLDEIADRFGIERKRVPSVLSYARHLREFCQLTPHWLDGWVGTLKIRLCNPMEIAGINSIPKLHAAIKSGRIKLVNETIIIDGADKYRIPRGDMVRINGGRKAFAQLCRLADIDFPPRRASDIAIKRAISLLEKNGYVVSFSEGPK